jgi:hypothetical protein
MPDGQTSQAFLPPVSSSDGNNSKLGNYEDSSDYVNVNKNNFTPFKLHKGKTLIENYKYYFKIHLFLSNNHS